LVCKFWGLFATLKVMPYSKIPNPNFKVQNFKNSGCHKKFLFNPIPARGFSLVELLVVLAIMGILATIGLARYNNFNARQQVKNAALELKSNLRKYQTYAISGQKNPNQVTAGSECNDASRTLNFYRIEITPSPTPPPLPSFLALIDCLGPIVTPPTLPGLSVPVATNFPWPDDSGIIVHDVGRGTASTTTSCGQIQIRFMPLNQSVGLFCGVGTTAIPIEPLGSDRVYVEITNSSNILYRVFVTNSGDIYEEKQP